MNDASRAAAHSRHAEHLPPDHPERFALANEVHARPYEALQTPQRAEYLAVLLDRQEREREILHLAELCRAFGVTAPTADASHFSASLGPVRIKWERHTEFSGYAFFAPGESPGGFGGLVTTALPVGWLAAIPGKTIDGDDEALLASMDRRAKLQLRLQQTVEGLSVAAITYYVVGLDGYVVKGLKAGGAHLDPEIAMAAAIPVVVIVVWMLIHRVRRKLGGH